MPPKGTGEMFTAAYLDLIFANSKLIKFIYSERCAKECLFLFYSKQVKDSL